MGELLTRLSPPVRCVECRFELWLPLAYDDQVMVGLYDDGRFPGRVILSLIDHYDHLDDVPDGLAGSFMRAVKDVMRAQRDVLDVPRVNVAILGNQEPHVHAHLIPRRAADPPPSKAPWEDPRERHRMGEGMRADVSTRLRQALVGRGFHLFGPLPG